MLYDTSLSLQQTCFEDADEAEVAFEKVGVVVDIFAAHAANEDNFVFPAIQRYEPSLIDVFEQEHEKDHTLCENLRGLMTVYRHAIKAGVKIETGQAINRAFTSFMIFNLEHMAKEELVLNKILWRYYTDADLAAINRQIVDTIPSAKMDINNVWMMRGLSNTEICGWLKGVEKNAPQPAFEQLFGMAERELPVNRFRKIQEGLAEGMMIA